MVVVEVRDNEDPRLLSVLELRKPKLGWRMVSRVERDASVSVLRGPSGAGGCWGGKCECGDHHGQEEQCKSDAGGGQRDCVLCVTVCGA